MRLSELSRSIIPLYETRVPVVLYGPPGVGKSDLVRSFPIKLSQHYDEDFGLVVVEASCLDAPDVIGFLVPTKSATGEAVARYTKPDIIRQIELTGLERGVLFIDEVGQADLLVQKAFAPLFIEGKLGEYRIPEGWYVISASNRLEDRAGVNKQLTHFTNRQCQVNIDAHVDDWIAWARANGIHHMLISFAAFRPGVVIIDQVPAKPGPYCTPRSFANMGKFLMNMVNGDDEAELPSDQTTQALVAGYIGEGASAELFSFIKVHSMLPTWDEIMTDPKKATCPPDDRLDAAYAAAGLLIAKAEHDTVDTAFTYARRLPVELQTMIARQMVEALGGSALNSPALASFVAEHKGLILDSIT